MQGMGHGLQSDNPTIAAAFRAALDHQLLILVILGVLLAVAWNVARTLHYRRAVAAGTADAEVADPWAYPEPPARRFLRLAFGFLWLFDGLLQLQAAMPLGLPGSVITPAASSSPGWVQSLVNTGTTIWSDHPVSAAAATVWIQVGVGVLLLVAPRGYWSRAAGAVSMGWGLVVWVFGEAFGDIFGHGSSWLFGLPGAVLFYAVAGLLVALPDTSWETPRLGKGVLRGMGVFFVGMGILQAWPGRGFWSGQAHAPSTAGTLTAMVQQMSQVSQPSVFSSWVRSFANFEAGHAWSVNFVVVALLIGIGVTMFSGTLRVVRIGLATAAVLCLAVWVLIQDFGFFGGVGTDPNSMIPIVFIFWGGYLAMVRLPARVPAPDGVDPTPEAVVGPAPARAPVPAGPTGWLDRLSPNYLLRSLLAIGALGIVLVGAAPMAVAATNPNADPILTEAANGSPNLVDVPARPVHPDRSERAYRLAVLSGRPHRGAHLPRSGVHVGLSPDRPRAPVDRSDAGLVGRPGRDGGGGGQSPVHLDVGYDRLRQAGGPRPSGQLDLPHRLVEPAAPGVERLRGPDPGDAGRSHDRPRRHRLHHRQDRAHPGDPRLRSRERLGAVEILLLDPARQPDPAHRPLVTGRWTGRADLRPRASWRRRPRAGRSRRPVPLGAVVLAAGILAACSSSGSSPSAATAPTPAAGAAPTPSAGAAATAAPTRLPPIPLTSSTVGSTTTWATVAMGHLDDPLNTFWQLVALTGGSSWQLATPPGVASNGGLVAATGATSVLAGFEPSQDLRFSPLARSADRGSTWDPGTLPAGLARMPDALAESDGGQTLALLRSGAGSVVGNGGDLSTWTPVTNANKLASLPGRRGCQISRAHRRSLRRHRRPRGGCLLRPGWPGRDLRLHPGRLGVGGTGDPGGGGGPTEVIRLVQTATATGALVGGR